MKKLIIVFTLFIGINCNAFVVQTIVTGQTVVDGKTCCYDMLHIIYDDDGTTYLTHGRSTMGTCCETSGVILSNPDLSENLKHEIIASEAFDDSRSEAISIYNAENGISFNSINIKNLGDELLLDIDSEYKGEFEVYVRNFSGVFLSYSGVIKLQKGENKISIPVVLEKGRVNTKYKVLVIKGDKGFRGTISNS
mgnify:CR=1 FL=1